MLNFAPEAQCSPTRSAVMTGRFSIRTGNTKATVPGVPGGLTAWERTMGDLFSDAGYSTLFLGKWHIGEEDGRWPTDHGFDEWYGPPGSYDCALWETDPWYVPGRDPVSYMMEGKKGGKVVEKEKITIDLKIILDTEYERRAFKYIEKSAKSDKQFLLYYNYTLMHMPVLPRKEFKGKTVHGDWADCLLQLDTDFGRMLDKLETLGLREDTITTFAGDNGNEEALMDRGTAGFWEGSYFTGMEGSLRTPCLVQWPDDREIDGIDQSDWLYGKQKESNQKSFLYWNADQFYGIKWRNFKCVIKKQMYMNDPVLSLPTPNIINLDTDPKEREPMNFKYLHTWTVFHFASILQNLLKVLSEKNLPNPALLLILFQSLQNIIQMKKNCIL